MDLQLVILVAVLSVSVYGIPPAGPKYLPVFVSSDALSSLSDKGGAQSGNQPNEPVQDPSNPQAQNKDYDIKKELEAIFNTPAPVYEHQPHENHDSVHQLHQGQYQENKPSQIQQPYLQPNQNQQPYLMSQQPGQSQQLYQINQQPGQNQQLYQINQLPGQIQQPYQFQQPGQQPYQIVQQPGQIQQTYQLQPQTQPILLAQQGLATPQQLYPNQQVLSGQPPQINQQVNQQPIQLNRQPFVPNQQIQAFQPAVQQPILLSQQPMGSQQIISTQPGQILLNQASLPNQQAILVQQPQSGQAILLGSNANNPVNLVQANPGPIQSQNQGNVYAVVPVGNQASNPNNNLVNTNTYLVPVQQLPNQAYAVNAGK